jgi:hypothetical protein
MGHIDILVVAVRRLSTPYGIGTLLAGPSPTSPMKRRLPTPLFLEQIDNAITPTLLTEANSLLCGQYFVTSQVGTGPMTVVVLWYFFFLILLTARLSGIVPLLSTFDPHQNVCTLISRIYLSNSIKSSRKAHKHLYYRIASC